jgi:hypothetical protein
MKIRDHYAKGIPGAGDKEELLFGVDRPVLKKNPEDTREIKNRVFTVSK